MTTFAEESARSLLDHFLETQKQIEESFRIKPGDDVEYYGWYSEELQTSRIENQISHRLRGFTGITTSRTIKSPPYTYWFQGKNKVLVTDVTNTAEVMQRHKETGSIFLGKLDKFCCRSFTKI
jgi:hypothetical protein